MKKYQTKWSLPLDVIELQDEEIALVKGGQNVVSPVNNGCNGGCNPGCNPGCDPGCNPGCNPGCSTEGTTKE